MGNRLNNLGMGPGPTTKIADQVQKMSDAHTEKKSKHLQEREKIIGGAKTHLHNQQ